MVMPWLLSYPEPIIMSYDYGPDTTFNRRVLDSLILIMGFHVMNFSSGHKDWVYMYGLNWKLLYGMGT